MTFLPGLRTIVDYYHMGGFVMPPLIVIAVTLWYGIAVRVLTIKRSRYNPRRLIERATKGHHLGKSVTSRALAWAIPKLEICRDREQLRSVLDEHFGQVKLELNSYKQLVRALVGVAPLLGLLGTVDGMIETFDSLGEMVLFSQTGGIAGGISRALFTTQVGLAISIPGILIGRIIDRRQLFISRELDQLSDLLCERMGS